jgi:hypothetical protein
MVPIDVGDYLIMALSAALQLPSIIIDLMATFELKPTM